MIKKLAGSIRQYKAASILTPVFMLGEVALECVIPLVMKNLIDTMETADSIRPTLIYGGILLALAFASLACGMLSGHFAAIASTGFARNLRKDMYHKIQDFSFANIDKFSTAGLVTRLTVDVSNVQNAFMMLIRMAVRAPLMLIFSVVMTITVSPKLSIIFAVLVPLLAVAMFLLIRSVYPIYRKAFKRYDRFNESIEENVRGMRVVKAYVREDYEKEKFDKESNALRKIFTKSDGILMISTPLMQLAVFTAVLLIASLGSLLIVNTFGGFTIVNGVEIAQFGELSIGGLSSLITYTMQILFSLMMFAMVITMITMSLESARRITEVLEEKSTIVSPENAVKEVESGEIEFDAVGFKYSETVEREALSNIKLKIPSGSTVGIIGGTGSGKTSLVQLIPRLYDVTSGSVKVGGRDVREYDVETLRDAVAMVLQKNTLFSGTVKENMRWGNENATDEEIVYACKLAQADDFVSAMPDGYETHIEQGGANVSGGQKQRLCIARAILKNPKVLILDDSTSAVDTHTDAKLRAAFREGLKDTTKIIIAQRTASVEDADEIIVLDDGKISAVGTHDELLKTSEIYREVYESQNRQGGQDNE
ncbi:MAG: ABC transporter ATP-binding protein [Clostridia bacterium]|nr:ABC transporter ATP-binding protein [Clostridia bacterium]